MTTLPIPTKMDDIDSEWLTAALREGGVIGPETNVTSSPRVTIGQGVGILGELARVTLEYDRDEPNAPKTLIAKIPTADPGGKAVAHMMGAYEKEARFYRELWDKVGVRAAKGYYTAGDASAVQYVVLMEDLGGLRLGDQVKGASAEECETLVTQVAKLHSMWWGKPELDAVEWIPGGQSDVLKLAAVAYAQSLQPFLTNFAQHLTAEEQQMAMDFMHRICPMIDAATGGAVTLCHGDLRLDNVFWGTPEGDGGATLVDWQIAFKGRGTYDIAYFMSQSVDPSVRAANEERLVREYHKQLVDAGVKDYSYDEAWDDYRLSTMFCFVYPVVACGSVDLANERGLELGTAMLKRSLAAIRDLDAAKILQDFEEQPHPMLVGAQT